jgi:hypothetical protein
MTASLRALVVDDANSRALAVATTMTVLAQILDVNDSPSPGLDAWWGDQAAANDDGTCPARAHETTAAGAGPRGSPCDADDGPHAPAPPWTMGDPRQHPASASANGCATYPGDFWADVLEYRAMRAQALGGVVSSGEQRQRFAELERRLRGTTDDVRRQFLRFTCRFRATIELPHREHALAIVLDASAGGAKVKCASEVHEGDPVVLELEAESLAGSVALPARIIWVRDGFVGLMFAGAPQWR